VTKLREVTAKQLEWPDPVAACTVREILSHGADGKDMEAAPSPLVERVAAFLAEVRLRRHRRAAVASRLKRVCGI
jgi:hypothetical protein